MYAKYDFRKKPSSKEDEDEQPLYPRIVSNGTIDFQQIVKEIAQASSFTERRFADLWKKRSQDLHIPPKFRWKNVAAGWRSFWMNDR